jgi:hypothetical protein
VTLTFLIGRDESKIDPIARPGLCNIKHGIDYSLLYLCHATYLVVHK